jgi:hypothetical protein
MANPRTARPLFLLGALLAVIGFIVFFKQRHLPERESIARQPVNERTTPAERLTAAAPEATLARSPGLIATPDARVAGLIRSSLEAFRANPDSEQAWSLLRALREGIRGAPEEEAAAAAIIEFLKTGADTPLGLPFTVGPDGMMDAVPTLRIALLDLLPSLDPLAALQVAREIMAKPTSPDEYALALRNLAWNDLNGDLRDELSARFLDLLKTPWLDQPSAGFLEAFDIAVEVGGTPMFDRLVSLAREAKSNSATSRAVFLSLDRMVLRDPALLHTALSANADWMDFAPQQRASLISRLDITQPEQRDLFRRYLSSTQHAAGELDYFAKIFPNGNFLYGHRLVTTDDATPTIEEVAAADVRVLKELDALESSVTGEAVTVIQKIRGRLKRP